MALRNAVLFIANAAGYYGDSNNKFRALRALALGACLVRQKLVAVIACAVCNTLPTSSFYANLCLV